MSNITNTAPAAISLKGGIQKSYTSMLLNYEDNSDADLYGAVVWYRESGAAKSTAVRTIFQYGSTNSTQIHIDGLQEGQEYIVSIALIDEFISGDSDLLDQQYNSSSPTLINISEYTETTLTAPNFISVRNIFTESKKLWLPNSTLEVKLSGSSGNVEILLRKSGGPWVSYYKGEFVEVINLPVDSGIYDIKLVASNQFYNATNEILPEVIYPSQVVIEASPIDPLDEINTIKRDQVDISEEVFNLTSDYSSFRDGLERRLLLDETLVDAAVYIDPENGTIVNRAYAYTDSTYNEAVILVDGVSGRVDIQATNLTSAENRITSAESTLALHSSEIALRTSTTDVEAIISTALSALIPAYSWQFNTGNESFTNTSGWNSLGYIINAAGTKIATPAISYSADDNVIYRLAVRKHVGGAWNGVIYFNTTGTLPVPSPSAENVWEVITIDATGAAGHTGTITLLEFDLGDCDIDYIEVGKRTASEVALDNLTARTTTIELEMDSGTGRMSQYATTNWVDSNGYQTASAVGAQIDSFDTTYAISATLTNINSNNTVEKANSASIWVDGHEANITSVIASYNLANGVPGSSDMTIIEDRLDAAEGLASTQIVSLGAVELSLQDQDQIDMFAAYRQFLLANSAELSNLKIAYAEETIQALVANGKSVATQLVTLGSQMEGANANIAITNQTLSELGIASATRDIKLSAEIGTALAEAQEFTRTSIGYCVDANGNPTSHANATSCTTAGYTWVEGPLAEAIRRLEIVKDGTSASLNDIREVFETLNGQLVARGSMISNVDGQIAGWNFSNDGTVSDFDIIADNFSVGRIINGIFQKFFYLDLDAPSGPVLVFKGRAEFGDYVVEDVNDIKTPRVTIRGTAFVFSVDKSNQNPDPTTITLTVDTDNVNTTVWSTTAGTLVGGGNTRTISHASMGNSLSATITVNGLDEQSNVVATDTFTVQSVSDGEDGLNGTYTSYIFSNSASQPATPTGGTYNGISETYPVGWTDDPVTPTSNEVIWVSKTTYTHNGTTWANSGWSTPSMFSGVDGVDGSYKSYIFRNADQGTLPATPTGGSYDGSTEVIPTGWTDDPVTPPIGQYSFVSSTLYSYNGTTWTNSGWSTPSRFSGNDGLDGRFTSYIFSNSASQPATPTGGSYDGSTEVIPTGWTDDPVTPPVGTRTWVSKTIYSYNGTNWVGASWSTPAQFSGEDGSEGVDGPFTSYIFRNAATVPSTPTGGSYNGTTETIPTGWADDPVTPGPNLFTWVSTTLYTKVGGNWTSTGWSTPAQFSGDQGDDGLQGSFTSYVFRNSASAPVAPSGGSYDGTTEVPPNNWTDDPVTPPKGQLTWMSKTIYDYNGTTWTNSGWSTPAQFSGEDGIDGRFTSYIFSNSASQPATPTGGSYDGSTEVIPTGWTDDPVTPNRGEFTWISKVVYIYSGTSWVKTAWSTPSKFSGEDGFEGTFTSYIYENSVSQPTTPTGGSYDGSTEVIPAGWNDNVPTVGQGESIWVSTTKYTYDGSWTNNGWTTPRVFVEAPTVVGYLTNETQQVSTDSNGNILSYAGLGGEFKVLQGAAEVPDSLVTFSYVGTNLTLSLNSDTGVFTVSELTASSGSASITAVYSPGGSKTYTITKVYNLSKSVPGPSGPGGVRGSKFLTLTLREGVFPSDSEANSDLLIYYNLTPVTGDILTYRNSAGTVSSTKEYTGSTWGAPNMLIDGSLVATGTISGDRLVAGTSISSPVITSGDIETVSLVANGTGTSGLVSAILATTDAGGNPSVTHAIGVQGVGYGALNNIGVQGVSTEPVNGVGVHGQVNGGIGVEGTCFAPSGFDFYASGDGANYGPFTGTHEGVVSTDFSASPGDIVSDELLFATKNISNAITKMRLSSGINDRAVRGVYLQTTDIGYTPSAMQDCPKEYRVILFNGVGEGLINVIGEGGNLLPGDLICSSSIPGKGMKQEDQSVERPYTIAQARHPVNFSNSNEEKQVAVIYLRG